MTTSEVEEKIARLARVSAEAGVAGVLLTTQASFAWLTGGRCNRVDGSREPGVASILVSADARAWLLASKIEMPRMLAEETGDLPLEPIEYPWTADRADGAFSVKLARRILGTDAPIGADWAVPEAVRLEGAIAGARAPLTSPEIDRYRALGQDAGRVVGAAMRAMRPGQTEREVARRLNDAAAACDARAIVTLVAADDRAAKFRHPAPSTRPWTRTLLAGICIERHGLIVALSRVVSIGAPAPDLIARTEAAARAFEALLEHTRPGATGAEIFAAVTEAYARAGFPGEEQRHHQGGATGYRSREWVAHPASADRVTAPQAFAWNPTVRGAKIEDTAIVTAEGTEIITASPDWPTITLNVRGATIEAAIVAELD